MNIQESRVKIYFIFSIFRIETEEMEIVGHTCALQVSPH